MNDFSITRSAALATAIVEYEGRHNGKRPARIFVSEEMFEELVREARELVPFDQERRSITFYGVPVMRYGSTGTAEFYLSDKEAI